MDRRSCAGSRHSEFLSARTIGGFSSRRGQTMGKRIKLREAQRRATAEAIAARLRAHARPKSNPAFIDAFCGFDLPYREQIEAYRELALRRPEDWRCTLRRRAPERRFLELVEFTFARYGVADHLKSAWIG